ncbi:ketosynthase chain-length factor [Actinoalloteichus sp. AHMU CJ021]|uniref:ketosynthase chain-length factor n=1 Tax=Actinoalloteichus TaxID=65496 RepID=UPI000424004C|nr:ketosynthase chain-length factor [Actinoalloteichus caeruleus]AUS77409.1 ketosynthase chain-length factor [Actinoalloteichus sp. AHMU CJ021]
MGRPTRTTSTARNAGVVTGLGVVAPTGTSTADHWDAVLAGRSGIRPITRFDASVYPVRHAGTVPEFESRTRVPDRLVPQTDRWTHFGLAAAEEALADADVDPAGLPEYEMAVVTASSSGGVEFGQREMESLYQHGPNWVSVYQSIAWFYAATTGQISIRHGMRGTCGVLCGEQAGGLDAIGQGRRLLRQGTRLVVTGGTDASLGPYGLVSQLRSGCVSTVDDPETAYLPFDRTPHGHLPGEGGALLVVETEESAATRGAGRGYGTVLGYAAGFDQSMTAGRPPVLARVIRQALDDARLDPSDVDVVFADAAGEHRRDQVEATALAEVLGPGAVPVTAPKTLTGRLLGGGAALDVATALLSLRDQVIPPTHGPIRLSPDHEIDLVQDEPREVPLRHALVVARGYAGFTGALVLGRGDRTH